MRKVLNRFAISLLSFGMITVLIAVFLTLNNHNLLHATTLLLNNKEHMILFMSIFNIATAMLSFGDRRLIVTGISCLIAFIFFDIIIYGLLLVQKNLFYIHLQMPVEATLDYGAAGFIFILIDGYLMLRVLTTNDLDIAEQLLLTLGLGIGVNVTLMILLGILWKISLLTIITLQIAFLLGVSTVCWYKGVKVSKKGLKNFSIVRQKIMPSLKQTGLANMPLIALLCTFVVIATYQAITYPAVEWDSLAYGLNYAKIIFRYRKIPVIAGSSIGLEMSASYPPGVQLLAVYFYMFSGTLNDLYYRIMQPIFGSAVMITTYKLAKILTRSRNAALFAIILLVNVLAFWDFFIYESYIMCLILMWTLSVYFYLKAYNSSNFEVSRNYENIGALFCGFSSLISYIGLLSLGILVLYAIYRKISLKRLISLVTLSLLIISPWYMRNALLLRNPLFPFLWIGVNLDPLLSSSTIQHFQNWLKGSLAIISSICKLGIFIIPLAIVYMLFFNKQKTELKFVVCLALYTLYAGVLTMVLHVPFYRYLLVASSVFSAVISGFVYFSISSKDLAEKLTAGILIGLALISSFTTIPYLNVIKPMYSANSKWGYLTQFYEDADAWRWINENAPQNARIATFEIREYYIERDVMLLDGYAAAPLYKTENIEEAIKYLRKQNVTHVLSVSWASPMDNRMPPAYKWCVLTRYLGDPHYLPPVYVSPNGAAVYHVGPVDENVLYENFFQKRLTPPLKHLQTNVTITNQTSPPSGKIYIPIPFDYREGLMMISTNSHEQPVYIKLLEGIIAETSSSECGLIRKWPPTQNPVKNPSFVWEIDKAGYLTVLITASELVRENFNITVTIDFYNYWDKENLFLNKDSEIYNLPPIVKTFPLLKVLYVQVNEPSLLTVDSATLGRKISLEIFEGLVPNNVLFANWTEQYKLITKQPSQNEGGEQNPSIKNFFLSYGKYSLLVFYRDNSMTQDSILLEVKLTSLRGR